MVRPVLLLCHNYRWGWGEVQWLQLPTLDTASCMICRYRDQQCRSTSLSAHGGAICASFQSKNIVLDKFA
jgi:hypothetical protein